MSFTWRWPVVDVSQQLKRSWESLPGWAVLRRVQRPRRWQSRQTPPSRQTSSWNSWTRLARCAPTWESSSSTVLHALAGVSCLHPGSNPVFISRVQFHWLIFSMWRQQTWRMCKTLKLICCIYNFVMNLFELECHFYCTCQNIKPFFFFLTYNRK